MSKSVKGLVLKDIKLIISQMKLLFVLMVVWAIFLAGSMRMTFFVGYVAILCSFLTLSTVNFDEAENGFAYLFTLPISRKDYVFEKYLFGFLLTTVPYVVIAALSWAALVIWQAAEANLVEYIVSISLSLPAAYFLLVLEIPLQIKFGQQKSRILTVVMVGCMSACLGVIAMISELLGTTVETVSSFMGLGAGMLALITAGILAVLFVLSYKISCKIIEKKEF